MNALRLRRPMFVCLPFGCRQAFDIMKGNNAFFSGFVTVGGYISHPFTTADYGNSVYEAILVRV
jgi:hypothetical protein